MPGEFDTQSLRVRFNKHDPMLVLPVLASVSAQIPGFMGISKDWGTLAPWWPTRRTQCLRGALNRGAGAHGRLTDCPRVRRDFHRAVNVRAALLSKMGMSRFDFRCGGAANNEDFDFLPPGAHGAPESVRFSIRWSTVNGTSPHDRYGIQEDMSHFRSRCPRHQPLLRPSTPRSPSHS
jgi:hypothetical protein